MAGVEIATAYVSIVPETSKVAPGIRQSLRGASAEGARAGKETGARFSAGLNGKGTAAAGKKAGGRFSGAFKGAVAGTLGTLGAVEIGRGIIGGLGKSISLATNFDLTLRQVGVQTGQTGKQLDQLGDLALKMGAKTAFSAQDANDAMLELAKGGLSAAQIKGGALNTSLLLAAAGGLKLRDASTYVVQGMTTFGLRADQAKQVAVALAGGANASTASVESLGQALSQVGPGAKQAGLSIQETVGALSAFDNAGIKGSDAGTSLKTFLQRLVPTTKSAQRALDGLGLSFVDQNGNFDSLATIAQKLQDKLGGLSQEQKATTLQILFGSDAARAASVITGLGAKGIEKYTAAAKDQKAAQDLANTAMSGASGAFQNFQGSVETLGIKLGRELLPGLTQITNKAADFVGGMTEGTGAGGEFAHTLGELVSIGKSVIGFFDGLPGPVKKFGVEALIAYGIVSKFGPMLGTTGGGLRGFVSGLANAETRAETTSKAVQRLGGFARQAAGAGGMVLLANSTQQASKGLGAFEGAAGGALAGFSAGGPIGAGIGAVVGGILGLVSATKKASGAFKLSKADADNYASSLNQISGAATQATRAQVLATLSQNKTLQAGLRAGLSRRTLIDAALGDPKAIAATKRAIDALNQSADGLRKKAAGKPAQANAAGRGGGSAPVVPAQDAKAYAAAQRDLKALNTLIGPTAKKYANLSKQQRLNYAATLSTAKLSKVFPKQIVTQIKTAGLPETHKGLVQLAHQYDLTPKKLVTLARLQGWDLSAKQAKQLLGNYDKLPKNKRTSATFDGKGAAGNARAVKKGIDNTFSRPSHAKVELDGAGARSQASALKRSLAAIFGGTIVQRIAVAQGNAKRRDIDGAKADGGPVQRGRTYLVGERGPELYTASANGRITPNHKLQSADLAPVAPTAAGAPFSGDVTLVLEDGSSFRGYIQDQVYAVQRVSG